MTQSPRIAVVTGGTGAIGTAVCHALLNAGDRVIPVGHPAEAEGIDAWQRANPGAENAMLCDLADFDSTSEMMEAIGDTFGTVSVLVNAAGITRDAPLKRMEAHAWRAVMGANLDSVFNATRPLIGGMIAAERGRIVNISSINGQKGQFGQTNYSAAKAGMHGFTMALAQEVARHGITVNTISPGYIDSPMIRQVPEAVREQILTGVPVGRFGAPQDIARAVAFLAHRDAGYLTGANLAVNGGQFMH